MAFEKLNYTTAGMDNESIQDKIDDNRLDIKQLTKENLKELKVDILKNNSYLKVRDHEGNIITNLRLKDNDVIDFNGENITHKVNGKTKVFLGVNFSDGKKGYVSADYLKVVKEDKITNQQQLTNNQQQLTNNPQNNTNKPQQKSPETYPTVKKEYDGNFKEEQVTTTTKVEQISKEELEEITKNYPKVIVLKDILEIWTQAAEKEKAGEILSMIGLGDKNEIEEGIKQSNDKFNKMWEKVTNLQQVSDTEIDAIFNILLKTEKEETIVSNMSKIKNILNSVDSSNIGDKKLEILDLMRSGAIQEGNSDKVEEKLRPQILAQNEFKNVNDILNNKDLFIFIENGDVDKLVKLGISKDLAEEVINTYGKIQRLQLKNKQTYIDYIKNSDPNISPKDLNDKTNFFLDLSTKKATVDLLSKELIFENLEKNPALENKNKINKIYGNLVGVGNFTFSDENITSATEKGTLLAISLIPMTGGMALSVYAARGAAWIMRTETIASTIANGGKIGAMIEATGFVASTALEGIAFYEGYNFTNNVFYKDNFKNILDGATNQTELVKSILFFGLLKGFSKIGQIEKIKNFSDKIPNGFIKNTGTLLTEAGILTGAGYGSEELMQKLGWDTDVEPEMTWEQYFEALIMVGLFKSRPETKKPEIKKPELPNNEIKKPELPNNEIKLLEYKPENIETYPIEYYKNKNSNETFTKSLDGKFFDSKGKLIQDSNTIKNLEKIEIGNKETGADGYKRDISTKLENNNQINSINYPKNAEFTVKREDGINFNFKTGKNGEILEISQGNGKFKIKQENYKEIQENCKTKNLKFYTNGSGQLVYELDGKLFKSDGTKSYAKRENLKEIEIEKEVKTETKKEEKGPETPKETKNTTSENKTLDNEIVEMEKKASKLEELGDEAGAAKIREEIKAKQKTKVTPTNKKEAETSPENSGKNSEKTETSSEPQKTAETSQENSGTDTKKVEPKSEKQKTEEVKSGKREKDIPENEIKNEVKKMDQIYKNNETKISDILKSKAITIPKNILKYIRDKTIGDIWNEVKSGYNNNTGGKIPFDIARTILVSGKSGSWNLKGIAGRGLLAGGLSYIDSNNGEIDGKNFLQNYYEILLFNWLGILAFESDYGAEAIAEIGTFLYNSLMKTNYEASEVFGGEYLIKYSNWVKENFRGENVQQNI
ncbi:MAG: hypothetical protein PHS49_05825 [Candidatus Gracilibacteria bacterium]|nr:hypothetical protein [Candidatus Gracilibacteria bacterium]